MPQLVFSTPLLHFSLLRLRCSVPGFATAVLSYSAAWQRNSLPILCPSSPFQHFALLRHAFPTQYLAELCHGCAPPRLSEASRIKSVPRLSYASPFFAVAIQVCASPRSSIAFWVCSFLFFAAALRFCACQCQRYPLQFRNMSALSNALALLYNANPSPCGPAPCLNCSKLFPYSSQLIHARCFSIPWLVYSTPQPYKSSPFNAIASPYPTSPCRCYAVALPPMTFPSLSSSSQTNDPFDALRH